MSKPTAALGLLAVMAAAWYWVLAPSSPAAVSHRSATRAHTAAASTPVPAVRLDALVDPSRVRPALNGRRNPFRAAAPDAAAATARPSGSRPQATAAPASSPAPAPAQSPRLELIGLAEARDGAGLVRTAIVSTPQGVLHARPGDVLAGAYRLERIGVDGVDVRLLPEDRLLRLALRR